MPEAQSVQDVFDDIERMDHIKRRVKFRFDRTVLPFQLRYFLCVSELIQTHLEGFSLSLTLFLYLKIFLTVFFCQNITVKVSHA